VDAALLEYMPDSALSGSEKSQTTANVSDPSKQYPWQPRKPLAEPMASALRRAAEAAGKSEFDAAAPGQMSIPQSGTGAAAAPARAREIPAAGFKNLGLQPTASVISAPSPEEIREIKRIEDPSAGDGWNSNSASLAAQAPSFSSLDENQASHAGGSKKTLLVVVLLLGLAAAGYFGWTKMQSAHSQPAVQQSAVPASSGTATLPAQPAPSGLESQSPGSEVVTPPDQDLPTTSTVPSSSKPSAAVVVQGPGLKSSVPAKAARAEDETTVGDGPLASGKTQPVPALMVKNGPSTRPNTEPEVQEPEAAPAATSIATGTSSGALSALVNTNAINARKAPQETLRISQGVSQGLILKRIQPIYPEQARQMRVEGKVELQADISKSGSITGVKQLSGDPLLGRAATDAVRQWKYKPYFLNGEPIEIQTQITVIFRLP
jgi:TonB family protein